MLIFVLTKCSLNDRGEYAQSDREYFYGAYRTLQEAIDALCRCYQYLPQSESYRTMWVHDGEHAWLFPEGKVGRWMIREYTVA